jgi:hypothetical protein
LSEELQEWLPGATSPQKICGKIIHDYTTVMNVSEVEKKYNKHIHNFFVRKILTQLISNCR